jgi:hypothetical protein
MPQAIRFTVVTAALSLLLALTACGGGGSSVTPILPTFVVTVKSSNPATGVQIAVTPADNSGAANGATTFSRTYTSGTMVSLTAPAQSGSNSFSAWTGCTSAKGAVCNVNVIANVTVTAAFAAPKISSVTVSPSPATVVIGTTQQFAATVAGTAPFDSSVTWSVTAPTGSTLSPGNITGSGLYTSPYPAPATVTIVATSVQTPSISGSVTVTLNPPATAAAPAVTIDAGTITHTINPYIYGMNAYQMSAAVAKAANVPIARFGGDNTSRYNYLLNVSNSASDYYFENGNGSGGEGPTGIFDDLVTSDNSTNTKTMGTVNVLGWVAKDSSSCSFPISLYPDQQSTDATGTCGNGVMSNGTTITGNDPKLTSVPADPTFAGNWVTNLVGKFGSAASGGIPIYDLDNEPTWWDAVHRDVHPNPSTYDEVAQNGLATALAIKTADPTAEVSGPVVDYWWNYFYSKKDIESGWGSGPCYLPWSNPIDRMAHNGVPFIEYYLQQFQQQETAKGIRLLDYVDLHTYFPATFDGKSVGFATAGDTGEQQARLDSTRVFWDPKYTDPNEPQPNYSTDANYTSSCTTPLQAPQVIPMMHNWVAAGYPGTKLAITEYNWGGLEHINGALTQADILGIFGREGLDLGTLWGAPDATTQVPGVAAFQVFRNYDGANSTFGDQALQTTSADQSKLAVYSALRSADNAITIVAINKTYGDLTSTLSLANLTASGNAKAYLYSAANLADIVAQPDVSVTPPASGSTISSLSTTFPAQSITVLILPQK